MKEIKANLLPIRVKTVDASREPDMAKMAGFILAHAPYDGSFELRFPMPFIL